MITFRALDGSMQTGEVWSAGPLNNTVWVLLPNGGAVVVQPTKLLQIAYQPPLLPDHEIPKELRNIAIGVSNLYWAGHPDQYSHMVRYLDIPDGTLIPTREQYDWAQSLIHQAHDLDLAKRDLAIARNAKTPLAIDRLRRLAGQQKPPRSTT